MNREVLDKINEEVNCTTYARNKIKGMGNEIADIVSKIEILSGMVGEDLLKEELYRNFVLRQRKEIKDIVAIFKNKLTYTHSFINAKPYNSSHRCVVAMANNKPLFIGMSPTIIKIELSLTEVDERCLEQYQATR